MNASGQFLRQSAFQAAGDQPVFRLDRVVLASGSPGFIAARSTLSSNAPACRTSRAQRTPPQQELPQFPANSRLSQAGGQPRPDQMPLGLAHRAPPNRAPATRDEPKVRRDAW
jgi:hypothetical protein